ncbi:MAG: flavodoxin [Lachnospiraceae bacterium]|nr:flavodoxin [Lachnospiraceae bacterium]
MLKKIWILLLSAVLLVTLCACGSNADNEKVNSDNIRTTEDKEKQDINVQEDSQPESSDSILIAYFSWSGNSKEQAELIKEQTGGTLFQIEREEPYPEDYTECTEVAKEEVDNNQRPAIKNPLSSVAEYNKIIVCYPIWWHTAPMCVGTFLENYDMTGKTIYPVSQSASMDKGQYMESVEFVTDCAKGANVAEGLFTDKDSEIKAYIADVVLK